MEFFQQKLLSLQQLMTRSRKRTVVLGDFNCRTALAGGTTSNARGRVLEELLEATGASCMNEGTATYCARGHESILDLVLVEGRLNINTIDFAILNEEIGSDHKAISVTIGDHPTGTRQIHINHRSIDFQIHRVIRNAANKIMNCAQIEPVIFQDIIKEEMAKIPQNNNRHLPINWWSPEIEDQRKIMQRCKIIAQRLRARNGMIEEGNLAVENYRQAGKKLNFLIKQAKRSKWLKLCHELNADPWGKAFKIITKRLGRHVPTLSNETSAQLVRTFFPRAENSNRSVIGCESNQFTQQEVMEAIGKLKNKKAQGLMA
ncbi:uncharacterized protein LOC142317847 [Lycorma delicatula]|uniref:uncharacterized protein LOC142317847 n=1 Tax=Lycorma delicatula TaxID=130591 RepID=UPI003F51A982